MTSFITKYTYLNIFKTSIKIIYYTLHYQCKLILYVHNFRHFGTNGISNSRYYLYSMFQQFRMSIAFLNLQQISNIIFTIFIFSNELFYCKFLNNFYTISLKMM